LKRVTIHSDGGCQGNPGPGGWAAVLEHGEARRELSGGAAATTNNRMELQAAIEALKALKEPCAVDFYTDSEYVRNGVMGWVIGWKRNGWKTKEKKPVKNEDLWRSLDALAQRHVVTWHWLKGHAGHAQNERCDQLATAEIAKIRKAYTRQALREALADFKGREKAKDRQPVLGGELKVS
jgi:ribonuclease HI